MERTASSISAIKKIETLAQTKATAPLLRILNSAAPVDLDRIFQNYI